MIMRSQK